MAVSFSSINSTLGTSYTDLAELCKSTAINMWARFKPIYCSDIGFLRNSRRSNSGHTVSGYSISWGIMKPSTWDWREYININTGEVKSGKWGYDKPQGGASSPYRLSDFVEIDNNGNTTGNGYYHHAVCPIEFHFSHDSNLPVPYSTYDDGTVMSFLFTFQNGVSGWNYGTCLYLSEIFSSELDYYPTVIMTCFQNNRVWEYCKSGDNKISYYTGNVNPFVQVLVNTTDFAEAICNDGASSYRSGPLADGQVWTCCMVLTSLKVEGGKTTHNLYSGSIRRLEYKDGVDRRDLEIMHISSLDDVVAMSYTVKLKKSSSGYYYIDTISVTTKTKGTGTLYFTVDATCVCLVGTVGGNGWNYKQQETRTAWNYLTVTQHGSVHTDTQNLNSSQMPTYNFTGDIGPNSRVAACSLTFRVGISELSGSFGFNVYDGLSEYSTTVVLKSES